MKKSAILAIALCAGCAGERSAARTQAGASILDAGGDAAIGSAEVSVPAIEVVARNVERVAPGMREIARLDPAPGRTGNLVADAGADTCVRAAFAASRKVRVRFVDARDAGRGEAAEGVTGTVPPEGPACVVRGDAMHLVVEAAEPARVRAVVVAAP